MDNSIAPSQLQPLALEVEQEDGKVSQERKGKAIVVGGVTGMMSTLSFKPTRVMGNEYNKLKEVRKRVSFLEKDLSTINATHEQLELMDEVPPGIINWRDDVREISYDMENCIDDFMRQFGGEFAEAGFIRDDGEATKLHKRFCELHQIANQIEEHRTLVVEVNARRGSYKIDDCKPSYGYVAVDRQLLAVYQEATNLVGIDGPMEEVGNWLTNTQKKLKVVSVVDFGGLGKTTLAKQVFEKVREQFDCVAFFSVSHRPDMRVLLNRLQLKLGIKESPRDRGFDDIIEDLRKYLANKRYLIVVDDLWNQSTWNTISCAFPDNGNGSRVLVTTRVEDVASVACCSDRECIHTMKPLNEQNSRMLFSNRVFGAKVVCPPYLKDVAAEILKKCGGLPLAIMTIASLLATQARSRKHRENIRKSLGAQSVTNLALKEMNSILKLSYTHLPLHIRPCFLYLGMYPEDHIIGRDDLVKQWIGEGFVSSLHGLDLEDVGRSYFNELVNRNTIQPSTTEYGEVLCCTVHDMMLDLILSKCVKDNFISVAYNSEHMARLVHGCKYKVRHLSLSSMAVGGATYGTATAASLSQVRSFILFKKPIPPLLWFKFLRVLIIIANNKEGVDFIPTEEIVDLTAISQLFQLRYLKVSLYGKTELPTELRKLVYLETLDIEHCGPDKSIPSDIVHLPRLSYVALPKYTEMPECIGNTKSLRTLRGFDLKKSSLECIMGLSELTNLRQLSMRTYYDLCTPKADALACSIGKLYNLECLCISHEPSGAGRVIDQHLDSLSNPFQYMERLDLYSWRFSRVPKWMGGLHCLRFLELSVEEMSIEGVHLLGELPSLVQFDFAVNKIPDERAILGTGLFPVLAYFHFFSLEAIDAYLGFEAGAMPNLRTLRLNGNLQGGTIPVGMKHLLHHKEILVYGTSDDAYMSAFREASLVHPNRPSVKEDSIWITVLPMCPTGIDIFHKIPKISMVLPAFVCHLNCCRSHLHSALFLLPYEAAVHLSVRCSFADSCILDVC